MCMHPDGVWKELGQFLNIIGGTTPSRLAVAFFTPCTWDVINVMLNMAANSHMLRAHVAKVSSLALPELSVSTTALLSQNI